MVEGFGNFGLVQLSLFGRIANKTSVGESCEERALPTTTDYDSSLLARLLKAGTI